MDNQKKVAPNENSGFVIEYFKKEFQSQFSKYYIACKDLIAQKPTFIERMIKSLERSAKTDLGATAAEKIVETASGSKLASTVTEFVIRIGSLLYYSHKDQKAKAQFQAAERFISTIEKAGGIAITGSLIAEYLSHRFFLLLLGLQKDQENNHTILANFFNDVVVSIILNLIRDYNANNGKNFLHKLFFSTEITSPKEKQDYLLQVIAEKIIPPENDRLYEENLFYVFTRKVKLSYGKHEVTISDFLNKCSALISTGEIFFKEQFTEGYPPQYFTNLKQAQEKGYQRKIFIPSSSLPDKNALISIKQEFPADQELIQSNPEKNISRKLATNESIKQFWQEHIQDKLTKKGAATIFYSIWKTKGKLIKALQSKNAMEPKPLLKYVNALFGFYYYLIFYLEIKPSVAHKYGLDNFLEQEKNWLSNLLDASNSIASNAIQNVAFLYEYLVKFTDDEIKQLEAIYIGNLPSFLNHLINQLDPGEEKQREISGKTVKQQIEEFNNLFTGKNLLEADPNKIESINDTVFELTLNALPIIKPCTKLFVEGHSGNTPVNYTSISKNEWPEKISGIYAELKKNIEKLQYVEEQLEFYQQNYQPELLQEALNLHIEDKCLIEIAAKRIKSEELFWKVTRCLIKYGAEPLPVIYKHSSCKSIAKTASSELIQRFAPSFEEAIKQLNTIREQGFSFTTFLKQTHTTQSQTETSQTSTEAKDNFLARIKKLFYIYVYLKNDYVRKLILFYPEEEKSLLKKVALIEAALTVECDIEARPFLDYVLAISQLNLLRIAVSNLGASFAVYKLPDIYSTFIEEISVFFFEVAKIFANRQTWAEALRCELQKCISLDLILQSLKFPLGKEGQSALFMVISANEEKSLRPLNFLFNILISRADSSRYTSIIFNLLVTPFIEHHHCTQFISAEQASAILYLTPLTLAALIGNLPALKLFHNMLNKLLQSEHLQAKSQKLDARLARRFEQADKLHLSPLVYAVYAGKTDVVRWLLESVRVSPLGLFDINLTTLDAMRKACLNEIIIDEKNCEQWFKKDSRSALPSLASTKFPRISMQDLIQMIKQGLIKTITFDSTYTEIESLLRIAAEQYFNFYETSYTAATQKNNAKYFGREMLRVDPVKAAAVKHPTFKLTPLDLLREDLKLSTSNRNEYFSILATHEQLRINGIENSLFPNFINMSAVLLESLLKRDDFQQKLIRLTDENGVTLLMMAVITVRPDLVAILVRFGALNYAENFEITRNHQISLKTKNQIAAKVNKNDKYSLYLERGQKAKALIDEVEKNIHEDKKYILEQLSNEKDDEKKKKLSAKLDKRKDKVQHIEVIKLLFNQNAFPQFIETLCSLRKIYTDISYITHESQTKIILKEISDKISIVINHIELPNGSINALQLQPEHNFLANYVEENGETLLHIFIKIYQRIVNFYPDFDDYLDSSLISILTKILSLDPSILFKIKYLPARDKELIIEGEKYFFLLDPMLSIITNSPPPSLPKFIKDFVVVHFTTQPLKISDGNLLKMALFICYQIRPLRCDNFYSKEGFSLFEIFAFNGQWQAFDSLQLDLQENSKDHFPYLQIKNQFNISTLHYLVGLNNQAERIRAHIQFGAKADVQIIERRKLGIAKKSYFLYSANKVVVNNGEVYVDSFAIQKSGQSNAHEMAESIQAKVADENPIIDLLPKTTPLMLAIFKNNLEYIPPLIGYVDALLISTFADNNNFKSNRPLLYDFFIKSIALDGFKKMLPVMLSDPLHLAFFIIPNNEGIYYLIQKTIAEAEDKQQAVEKSKIVKIDNKKSWWPLGILSLRPPILDNVNNASPNPVDPAGAKLDEHYQLLMRELVYTKLKVNNYEELNAQIEDRTKELIARFDKTKVQPVSQPHPTKPGFTSSSYEEKSHTHIQNNIPVARSLPNNIPQEKITITNVNSKPEPQAKSDSRQGFFRRAKNSSLHDTAKTNSNTSAQATTSSNPPALTYPTMPEQVTTSFREVPPSLKHYLYSHKKWKKIEAKDWLKQEQNDPSCLTYLEYAMMDEKFNSNLFAKLIDRLQTKEHKLFQETSNNLLLNAILMNEVEKLKILLEYGADVTYKAIAFAAIKLHDSQKTTLTQTHEVKKLLARRYAEQNFKDPEEKVEVRTAPPTLN